MKAYLLSDGNQELQSLGINVSDLDTSLATRQYLSRKQEKGRTG